MSRVRVRVRGWWLGPLLLTVIGLTPWPAWFVERLYSRGIYPYIQRVMTTMSNVTPWAVMDGLLVAAAVYEMWRLVRTVAAARVRGRKLVPGAGLSCRAPGRVPQRNIPTGPSGFRSSRCGSCH